MVCADTWPNYRGGAQDGSRRIIEKLRCSDDVQYGKTKVFIRTPQTVFKLENERSKAISSLICVLLQKVRCFPPQNI